MGSKEAEDEASAQIAEHYFVTKRVLEYLRAARLFGAADFQ